jgi:beta propeller repeat protein
MARADVAGTSMQIGALAGATQTAPAVSGTGVTWTNLASNNFDIYYLDLAVGGTPRNLTNTPTENEFLEDIDGGYVVWTHTSPTAPGDIVLYDVAADLATPIAASSATLHFQHPAVGGRYVVFERITNQYDIDVFDITLGASPGPQVTNDPAMQLHPRVSGDVIVYEDYNSDPNNPAVFGSHVATSGPPFSIAAAPAHSPDVDGSHVVFVAPDAKGNDQIMLYDLTNGAARPLTTFASHKLSPRISGNRIVWSDDRNGGTLDVYAFDLTTGVEDLLAGGPGDQYLADLDGGRVVYTSNASGAEAVYVFTYASQPPPPPNLPPGCDPAKSDLVDGPVTLTLTTPRPVYAAHNFKADATRTYYMCVENGKPDGSERSAHVLAAVDDRIVLTPHDFKPANNPPHWVATKLRLDDDDDDDDDDHCGHHHGRHQHVWAAAMFAKPTTTIKVSIRVSK